MKKRTVSEVIKSNFKHFMKRGPALSYAYGTYVVARDSERGYVLLGGLGAMGVGQMWCKETERDKEKPGYSEAPIQSSEGGFGTQRLHLEEK